MLEHISRVSKAPVSMSATAVVLVLSLAFTQMRLLMCSSAFIMPTLSWRAHSPNKHRACQLVENRIYFGRCTPLLAKNDGASREAPNDQPEISDQSQSSSQTISTAVQSKNQLTENEDQDGQNYAYNIPKTGFSLADQLENKSPENRERFETILTPVLLDLNDGNGVEIQYDQDGFPMKVQKVHNDQEDDSVSHQGVARIDTFSTFGSIGEEPLRWLVSLGTNERTGNEVESYAMIDLPPYSDRLADDIRAFMDPMHNATDPGSSEMKGRLSVILLTNQQCIHYDSSPAVYVTRKSDLKKWKNAFPDAQVVMYRLDIPRECREEISQTLDGYGPWGWDEVGDDIDVSDVSIVENRGNFVETGRPLTIEEWDDDTKSKVLNQGELPPEDQVEENTDLDSGNNDNSLYSPEAIREREEKYRLLAVYTPGHTFGSVTYIIPQRGICCSGYTLPLESSGSTLLEDDYGDADDESVLAMSSNSIPRQQGPRLDYQGYLATSASRPRQMSSALSLINDYIDRFRVVLPARGDVIVLDTDTMTRKRELLESVGLYQKIGNIYSRLGIVE